MDKIFVITMAVIAAIGLSGCGSGHADIPEFTTSSDRDTGFVPSTFSEQHETESAGSDTIKEKVVEGVSEVESSSAEKKQFDQFSQELEDGIEEVQDGISQFVAEK